MNDSTLDRHARSRLALQQRRGLLRELRQTSREECAAVIDNGTRLLSFTCNDYLGLSHHPEVIAASVAATQRFGAGAGASRLVTGNHPLYRSLEQALIELKGTDDAVVFGSGYLASLGALSTLAAAPDLILLDELCHSCLFAGAALSAAKVLSYRHNDMQHLTSLLGQQRGGHRHCLIVTEGVFSMDGDRAPLPALAETARQHDAWLVTDDAHALGVIGGGRGSGFAHDRPVAVDVQIGTLSKAAGSYGGYVCGSRPVADLLRNRARSLVYSTGLPPGAVAAAIAGLRIIASDPQRVAIPLQHARTFTAALQMPAAQSAIVALPMGTPEGALRASHRLRDQGFLVVAIRPPTVPAGTSRLRVTFSAAHSQAQVLQLAAAVRALDEQGPPAAIATDNGHTDRARSPRADTSP